MRPRSIAVSAATLIAAASMTPLTAHAAGQNTLFVDGSSSACTNSGSGTSDAPFCTIQAAADAADPGDVVNVSPGTYGAFTVSRSGTASAPVVFTGNGTWNNLGRGTGATVGGVTLSGADYVEVEGFDIEPAGGTAAVVDGGSDITFGTDLFADQTASGQPLVHVTGAASAVTVQDSKVDGNLTVDDGSAGTILTTNEFSDDLSSAISLSGASNAAVTGNTIQGCGTLVSVAGSSGTSIENNLVAGDEAASAPDANCPAPAQSYGISVDASSAASTTSDYNDVYVTGDGSAAYDWDDTPYAAASGLYTAVGQGLHDYNSAESVDVTEHSPLINSANSAAIGEQAADINGNPRVDDPLVAPTGTGPYDDYDRGAIQFQDPLTAVSSHFSAPTQVPAGAAFTLDLAMTDTWSDKLEYEYVLAGSGQILGTDSSGSLTTSIPSDGYYLLEVEARPQGATTPYTRLVERQEIDVVAPAALTPQIFAQPEDATSVYVNNSGTTDAWNITGVTYDFGDGTPAVTTTNGSDVTHDYAAPGVYKITETVTDFDGDTATTATTITTNLPPAGTLVDFAQGPPSSTGEAIGIGDTPAASNVAQAAIAGMPDGSSQYAAVTKTGEVEFTLIGNSGTWPGWTTLSQPGVQVKSVSMAGLANGSSQLIEVTSTGVLEHIVRNANGTWQNGWGIPSGSTGFTEASITAMPDGSTQLVAVTTGGRLMHNIRFANGSWQGWRPLSQPGVTVKDASIAGLADGSSQIIEITTGGLLKHDIRFANGSWQAQGWGSPVGSGGLSQASITALYGGATEIAAVTDSGTIQYNVRNADGSWTNWSGFNEAAGGSEQLSDISNIDLAGMPNGNTYFIAVSAG